MKYFRLSLTLCVLILAVCGFSTFRQDTSQEAAFIGSYFWLTDNEARDLDPAFFEFTEHKFRESLTGFTSKEIKRLTRHFIKLCKRYQLHPAFVLSLIEVESHFRADARSHRGAVGLMQIMPSTAEHISAKRRISYDGPADLYDPWLNTQMGMSYLYELKTRYGGNPFYVLAAYNAGPTRIDELIEKRDSIFRDPIFKVTYGYYALVKRNYYLMKNASLVRSAVQASIRMKDTIGERLAQGE